MIVVAIIAVLVAVSIPIFTAQLEKSREATDIANMRAAKAALVTKVLDDDVDVTGTIYCYDAAKGILTDGATLPDKYGKGTKSGEYKTEAGSAMYFWIMYGGKSEAGEIDDTDDNIYGVWSATKPSSITSKYTEAYEKN